jgi:lipopolysaccharide/colanic/teichoic acid biosynthesis glycosyltransferase
LDYSVIGRIEDISEINFKKMPKRIIVAVRYLTDSKIKYIQSFASRNNISLNFLPSIESFKNNPVKLKDHYGIPLLSLEKNEQSIFYKSGKRLFDIFFSLILFSLSLPLWIVIPILIKKDSSGKIFFHQDRVGLNNKEFKIYKFRSMKSNTPSYANCPTDPSDERVTKVGRWLRKTSIDELPQILNILKGEMSVIGPRPEMPFIVNNYNSIERNRLMVKPGLTGLWQVSPYRNSDISHNLEYDFYYIENQGFILDFIILLMTVFFVVKGITN